MGCKESISVKDKIQERNSPFYHGKIQLENGDAFYKVERQHDKMYDKVAKQFEQYFHKQVENSTQLKQDKYNNSKEKRKKRKNNLPSILQQRNQDNNNMQFITLENYSNYDDSLDGTPYLQMSLKSSQSKDTKMIKNYVLNQYILDKSLNGPFINSQTFQCSPQNLQKQLSINSNYDKIDDFTTILNDFNQQNFMKRQRFSKSPPPMQFNIQQQNIQINYNHQPSATPVESTILKQRSTFYRKNKKDKQKNKSLLISSPQKKSKSKYKRGKSEYEKSQVYSGAIIDTSANHEFQIENPNLDQTNIISDFNKHQNNKIHGHFQSIEEHIESFASEQQKDQNKEKFHSKNIKLPFINQSLQSKEAQIDTCNSNKLNNLREIISCAGNPQQNESIQSSQQQQRPSLANKKMKNFTKLIKPFLVHQEINRIVYSPTLQGMRSAQLLQSKSPSLSKKPSDYLQKLTRTPGKIPYVSANQKQRNSSVINQKDLQLAEIFKTTHTLNSKKRQSHHIQNNQISRDLIPRLNLSGLT